MESDSARRHVSSSLLAALPTVHMSYVLKFQINDLTHHKSAVFLLEMMQRLLMLRTFYSLHVDLTVSMDDIYSCCRKARKIGSAR